MKRFVSYLYSVYNNQKIHNAGFARMELRTGRNRVEIHLKENGYSGKTGTVYLFIRKQKNIQGISIGNITFRNNQADFRFEQTEDRIGQTPYQIMQMHGILIIMDERVAFLSQWDEQPVDTAKFRIWDEKENPQQETQQIRSGRQPEPSMDQKTNAQVLDTEQPGSPKESLQPITEPETAESKIVEPETAEPKTAEPKTAEPKTTEPETAESETTEPKIAEPETEESKTTEPETAESETTEPKTAESKVDVYKTAQTQEDITGNTQTEITGTDSAAAPAHTKTTSDLCTAELQPQTKNQWEQTWRYMLRTYPTLYHFAEENQVLCVRIEIKDVRLLPAKYWSMVNNSFLLHGFFNYRYLAFGRIGQNWFVGIPGIYQKQEHVMASVFGFPDFLPQKQKTERGEQPGYWYRILEI